MNEILIFSAFSKISVVKFQELNNKNVTYSVSSILPNIECMTLNSLSKNKITLTISLMFLLQNKHS